MEGGPGKDTSQLASSPITNSQNQDSVIASFKELIKEQVNIIWLKFFTCETSACEQALNFLLIFQDDELGKVRGKCVELETNYAQVFHVIVVRWIRKD